MNDHSQRADARQLLSMAAQRRMWPSGELLSTFRPSELARGPNGEIVRDQIVETEYTIHASEIEEAIFGQPEKLHPHIYMQRFDEDVGPRHGVFIGPSIHIAAARIEGQFSLQNLNVARAFYFWNCHFEEPLTITDCQLRQFVIRNSTLHSIAAHRLECDKSFIIRRSLVRHGIVVSSARIGGALSLDGSRIIGGDDRRAVAGQDSVIGGTLYLNSGFHSDGRVNFSSSRIGGSAIFRDGSFHAHPDDGMAVAFFRAQIGSEFRWADVKSLNGRVDLRMADVDTLSDRRNSWPGAPDIVGDFRLDGLKYRRVAHDTDSQLRLRWLKSQRPEDLRAKFKPHPWTQMASALRGAGHEIAARQILVGREKHRLGMFARHIFRPGLARRVGLPYPLRSVGRLLSAVLLHISVLHGYSPTRGLAWCLAIVAAGSILFGNAYRDGVMWPAQEEVVVYMDQTGATEPPAQYEQFNSLMYSVDLFVPLLDLRQQSHWTPKPPPARLFDEGQESPAWQAQAKRSERVKWLVWTEACIGWILTTLTGLAFSGVLRRD